MSMCTHIYSKAMTSVGGNTVPVYAYEDRIGALTYSGSELRRIDTPNGYISEGATRYCISDHQGNVRQVVDSVGTVLQDNHYYPFGMLMGESSDILEANRTLSALSGNPYRYSGNRLITHHNAHFGDFHARWYDFQTLRFLQSDEHREKYYSVNSYLYCAGIPIMLIDNEGLFPILINGYRKDNERGKATYWASTLLSTIQRVLNYDKADFIFVDGNQGFFSDERFQNGKNKGLEDADFIYSKLKEYEVDGNILEQIQVFSHSRGVAFAAGYIESLNESVSELAKKEGISLNANGLFEFSINLAPHGSNILFSAVPMVNIAIRHHFDFLASSNIKGNVIFIQSPPNSINPHGNAHYTKEVSAILNIIRSTNSIGQLIRNIRSFYRNREKDKNGFMLHTSIEYHE